MGYIYIQTCRFIQKPNERSREGEKKKERKKGTTSHIKEG
jgi:hypothetical protein